MTNNGPISPGNAPSGLRASGPGARPRRCHGGPVAEFEIERVEGERGGKGVDLLSVEEPLEIRIWTGTPPQAQPLAVTMRTPGDDLCLAAGFLFTEGLIAGRPDIAELAQAAPNAVDVRLQPGIEPASHAFDRHSFVSSSCGACGKRSIAAVMGAVPAARPTPELLIAPETIHHLPERLRAGQTGFSRTGGVHASGLFNRAGELIALREDVGRHNALDKLIGSELLDGHLPLSQQIVLVSGRLSFELVQKAAMAGVPVLCAVGAPSSLAVDLARTCGMTLVGFVREGRYNIYAGAGRIAAPLASETPDREQTP